MERININIKDDISEEKAMWFCLRCYQKFKKEKQGVVTFHDGSVASMDTTKKGNLTFKVFKKERK